MFNSTNQTIEVKNQKENPFIKEEAKSLIGFLTTTITATATLNLFLFWGRFDINPFIFIQLTDVISIASPFITQAASILCGVYFSFIIFPPKISDEVDHEIKRYVIPFCILGFFTYLTVFYFSDNLGQKWTSIAFYGSIGMSVFLVKEIIRSKEFNSLFESNFSRRTAAFATIFMPFISVFLAYSQSNDIINKNSFSFIKAADLNIDLGLQPTAELPLLGKLGELYIVTTPDLKQKIFLSPSNFKVIRLESKRSK